MKQFCILSLVLSNFVSAAQTFVAEAQLSPVEKDGFHNITLTPETSQYLNNGFTNIRIFDDKNKEVPYLLRVDVPHNVTEVFRDYSIIEEKQTKNCCTNLVLHNPEQRLSNNIQLVIKNADVTKEATLLGSDDKEHWFALNQQLVLTPASSKEATSEIKIVNFPLSNYQYYSLQIDDSTSAPLNILTAGYFEVQAEDGKYSEVPVKGISKTDSTKEKRSYLHIRFDGPCTIDKVELSMNGAPFFLRRASIHVPRTRKVKGGDTETFYDYLRETEITSKRPTSVELSPIKTKELLIIIDNEDNPPLEVDKFTAFQLNRRLTAWLAAGTAYTVKFGPPELATPVYDISFFKDSIPPSPAEVQVGRVKLYTVAQSSPTNTIFTTKAYIWAAVVFVIALLGFMSVRLLNEAKNSGDKA